MGSDVGCLAETPRIVCFLDFLDAFVETVLVTHGKDFIVCLCCGDKAVCIGDTERYRLFDDAMRSIV
jgi:hypothetical protein